MPTYVNSKIYHTNGSNIKIIDQSVIEENGGWLREELDNLRTELNHLKDIIEGDTPPDQPSTAYYWYVGTTKPTSLSQASVIKSYPAEQTYTNNSGAKSKIYVLTNSDKNVTFIEPNLNVELEQESIDTATISGYKIFATLAKCANGGVTKIRIS